MLRLTPPHTPLASPEVYRSPYPQPQSLCLSGLHPQPLSALLTERPFPALPPQACSSASLIASSLTQKWFGSGDSPGCGTREPLRYSHNFSSSTSAGIHTDPTGRDGPRAGTASRQSRVPAATTCPWSPAPPTPRPRPRRPAVSPATGAKGRPRERRRVRESAARMRPEKQVG